MCSREFDLHKSFIINKLSSTPHFHGQKHPLSFWTGWRVAGLGEVRGCGGERGRSFGDVFHTFEIHGQRAWVLCSFSIDYCAPAEDYLPQRTQATTQVLRLRLSR